MPDETPEALGADQIILCCIYWDGTLKEQLPKEFVHLLEYVQDNTIPILVCGDLIVHSEIRGLPIPYD